MHEASSVEALLDRLQRDLGPDAARVRLIRLRAGAGTSRPALETVFRALAQGTSLASAALDIEILPANVACRCGKARACSAEESETGWVLCPGCATPLRVPHGHSLEVTAIEWRRTPKESGHAPRSPHG